MQKFIILAIVSVVLAVAVRGEEDDAVGIMKKGKAVWPKQKGVIKPQFQGVRPINHKPFHPLKGGALTGKSNVLAKLPIRNKTQVKQAKLSNVVRNINRAVQIHRQVKALKRAVSTSAKPAAVRRVVRKGQIKKQKAIQQAAHSVVQLARKKPQRVNAIKQNIAVKNKSVRKVYKKVLRAAKVIARKQSTVLRIPRKINLGRKGKVVALPVKVTRPRSKVGKGRNFNGGKTRLSRKRPVLPPRAKLLIAKKL